MGFFKNLLPSFIYYPLYSFSEDYIGLFKKSYSNEGEDILLQKIFSHKKKAGFYVDIGCYHPKTYSNTYFFYKKNWKGINVDANPISIAKFNKFRKRDINLNSGVGNIAGNLIYYNCNVPACNTFSEDVLNEKIKNNHVKLISKINVEIKTLAQILDEHLPKNQSIDFMDIDVEGFDFSVLQANNWEKYRPKIILVEDYHTDLIQNPEGSEIYALLTKQNYTLIIKTFGTLFFQDNLNKSI